MVYHKGKVTTKDLMAFLATNRDRVSHGFMLIGVRFQMLIASSRNVFWLKIECGSSLRCPYIVVDDHGYDGNLINGITDLTDQK